jgi:putative membrane protein
MLYVKALHIIAMVAWFSGLFYLPRLFVYHAATHDLISSERFKIMERRLYYGITWPAALLTTILGVWLLSYNPSYYLKAGWMHAKLGLVVLLWIYHLSCGHYRKAFAQDRNRKSTRFFRIYNEMPTLLLVGIVLLVVVK